MSEYVLYTSRIEPTVPCTKVRKRILVHETPAIAISQQLYSKDLPVLEELVSSHIPTLVSLVLTLTLFQRPPGIS